MTVKIQKSVLFRAAYDIQVFPLDIHVLHSFYTSMLFLQETTPYAPPCQSGRPPFPGNDVSLHVRVFPGLLSLIIAPGPKRDITFRWVIMSPETVPKCNYL